MQASLARSPFQMGPWLFPKKDPIRGKQAQQPQEKEGVFVAPGHNYQKLRKRWIGIVNIDTGQRQLKIHDAVQLLHDK